MKRKLMLTGLILFGICIASGATPLSKTASPQNDYVIIGWNDLGMHCITPSYAELALLPPFNNLWVQVIKKGDPPKIVTSGFTLEYSIQNNTTVNGKTDFWQYGAKLFADLLGIPIPPAGIGLTGNGLSGNLKLAGDHFEATGIPVLPKDDKMNWNPYQIATVTLRDTPGKGNKIGQSVQVVLPVSDEIKCDMCHALGGDGTKNINGGVDSAFTNILMVHDYYHGTSGTSFPRTSQNLVDVKPVLCANCHSSNALGAKGDGTSKSVSLAMHGWHNPETAPDATCYSCHPGEITQCLRTSIGGMGYLGTTPSCADQRDANGNLISAGLCHGGMTGMGNSGRNPWITEPNCEQCHGNNYSTGGNLYRHSKGHGGVYCAACHNSPHAWWPSKLWADSMQPMKLERAPYALYKCSVCHTKPKAGDNPHVIYYLNEKK